MSQDRRVSQQRVQDAAKLRRQIRDLEKRGTGNLEQLSEIERLRSKVKNLEEGNKKLTEEKGKLEGMIRDQYSRDIFDLIEDIYSQMEMRFDMTRRNVRHPTNRKILDVLFKDVHALSLAFGPIPPTEDQLWEKIHEFFAYITTDGHERQKRIDKKTKNRITACRTLIEALEKNPFMKDPPMTLKELRILPPSLKAAYMSSDEEVEEEDPIRRRKRRVYYTRILPWEADDFCLAKQKLDAFYYRILNPKAPDKIPVKDTEKSNQSRRRLVKNPPLCVIKPWSELPRDYFKRGKKTMRARTASNDKVVTTTDDDMTSVATTTRDFKSTNELDNIN